jgi:outer membrane protein OmpU
MKKVLLATTALVMTAGVAAAEVSVTGSVDMGMKYDGSATATSKTTQHTDVAINFEGSVETDGGLTLSAFTAIISTNEAVHGNNGTGVSVAGPFGTLSMGSVGEADVQGGLADIGFEGIGIDNVAEAFDGAVGHNVNYTYSASGITASVSALMGGKTTTNTKGESYSVGLKYSFGSSYVGVGMQSSDMVSGVVTPGDGDTTSIYAGTSMDAFSVNAMYSSFDSEVANAAKQSAQGINVAYTTGAATISFGYSDKDTNTAGEKSVYGVGVTYDLGGGASLKAGAGKIRGATETVTKTVADLGVSFKF